VGEEKPGTLAALRHQLLRGPTRQIIAQADEYKDELIADFDLDMTEEVRNTQQFFPRPPPETTRNWWKVI
jgi:N-carbamoylputrescine amidase